jgi:hypothetical protein
MFIIDLKAQRLDQVKRRKRGRAKARDAPGIRRDLGL